MPKKHVVFSLAGPVRGRFGIMVYRSIDVRDKLVVNSARANGNPSSVAPDCTILVGFRAWHIEICGTHRVCSRTHAAEGNRPLQPEKDVFKAA
jgi:hypothetical protein